MPIPVPPVTLGSFCINSTQTSLHWGAKGWGPPSYFTPQQHLGEPSRSPRRSPAPRWTPLPLVRTPHGPRRRNHPPAAAAGLRVPPRALASRVSPAAAPLLCARVPLVALPARLGDGADTAFSLARVWRQYANQHVAPSPSGLACSAHLQGQRRGSGWGPAGPGQCACGGAGRRTTPRGLRTAPCSAPRTPGPHAVCQGSLSPKPRLCGGNTFV